MVSCPSWFCAAFVRSSEFFARLFEVILASFDNFLPDVFISNALINFKSEVGKDLDILATSDAVLIVQVLLRNDLLFSVNYLFYFPCHHFQLRIELVFLIHLSNLQLDNFGFYLGVNLCFHESLTTAK